MAKTSAPLVGFLLFCFLVVTAQAGDEYMKYKDPKQTISKRIRDLMKRMNLDEKIGQMVQIDRKVATPEVVRDYKIGSILSGGGSVPRLQATPQEWINMVNGFQNGSLSTRLWIPMIYGIDAVHGHNNVYNVTIFPHNVGLGATRIGSATALEVRATGINYCTLHCGNEVFRDPRWGRGYESYSEDPNTVRQMTDIINGLQGEIPKGSTKGAPYVGGKYGQVGGLCLGDGGTTKGINENNTVIDRHGLLSIHMPGYNAAVAKGGKLDCKSLKLNMKPAAEMNNTLFMIICAKLKGFFISDWQAIDRMTYPVHANYTYSVPTGIQAGLDMIIAPCNYTEFIDTLTGLVNNNFIPMSRIDYAAHRDLAREAGRKSLVLLKNGENVDEPMLPLPKNSSKILVADSHADNLGNQCGGWTIN
ncbi:wall-associated receptor kinase 2-like [Hibiscus syriacus]|uniref:Wall-associated receptor kinase 2-like n=1 Tax=Hibiscus syriacus TaxID=106335 RepID=A0A6A3CZT1_HIBSY|nr:wall-associated receptor kinase 2-like [Hibiscus syriacus]